MRKNAAVFPLLVFSLTLAGCAGQAILHITPTPRPKEKSASQPTPTPLPPTPAPPTRILLTGDINLGRCIADRALRAATYSGNYHYPFEFVADALRAADLTVGSLDSSLSDIAVPLPCSRAMNLIAPARMAEGLQFAGFDLISVATNHVKDCGAEGYECDSRAMFDTLETLRQLEIQTVGAGEDIYAASQPVYMESNGARFAFLGVNEIEPRVWADKEKPGTAALSDARLIEIEKQIAAIKQEADAVIVLAHWGVEYAAAPEENQRAWGRALIDAGAALVIGNHPHIVQPVEAYHNGLIFYALGNFVFDQPQMFQRESVAAEVTFENGRIKGWKLIPAKINYYTYQTYWAQGTEAEIILARAKSR